MRIMSLDLSFLKTALPALATALGGPLAGLAAGFVADKLGLEDKTVENITNIISGAPPEQLIKLKEIDTEFKKFILSLGIKEIELENADRDSARRREMEVKDKMPAMLAAALTLGFFGCVGFLMKNGFPEGNKDVLVYMLGSLNTAWLGAMAYYFSTTKSSKQKDIIIANSTPA